MPGRNQQNTMKVGKTFDAAGTTADTGVKGQKHPGGREGRCPKCDAPVPPRPGFRFSSLTCPKCGASMGKK